MRVTTVQAARKDQGTCGRCHDPIPVGSPYRWVKGRYGPRKVRCMKPTCTFKASELTSNDKDARLLEVSEEMTDTRTFEDTDDVQSALSDWAERVREVGEEYEESAQSIEDGFQHSTYLSDEMTEKGEAAAEWADSIENADIPESATCEECGHDWHDDECGVEGAKVVDGEGPTTEYTCECLNGVLDGDWHEAVGELVDTLSGECPA